MTSWRAKVASSISRWRTARTEVKQAKELRREERQAEELDMAREGLSRRPGGYGL